mmetsp:Transcript_5574/g.9571  ORF Transcript_5574/g.9571 Transcript_5574/m.9571 type:complete len:97 (-) Transcript_5574:81-371(-)
MKWGEVAEEDTADHVNHVMSVHSNEDDYTKDAPAGYADLLVSKSEWPRPIYKESKEYQEESIENHSNEKDYINDTPKSTVITFEPTQVQTSSHLGF